MRLYVRVPLHSVRIDPSADHAHHLPAQPRHEHCTRVPEHSEWLAQCEDVIKEGVRRNEGGLIIHPPAGHTQPSMLARARTLELEAPSVPIERRWPEFERTHGQGRRCGRVGGGGGRAG